jgi:hypothetical protein
LATTADEKKMDLQVGKTAPVFEATNDQGKPWKSTEHFSSKRSRYGANPAITETERQAAGTAKALMRAIRKRSRRELTFTSFVHFSSVGW